MQKVDINLTGTETSLTILEGKTLEQKPPEKIRILGDIKTFGTFIRGRAAGYNLQMIDPNKAIITVTKDIGMIHLELDPENYYGAQIGGKLELSEELQKWTINTGKTWKLQELTKHLRFSKLDFDDKDKHEILVKAYQSFNFKALIDSLQESDTRGNQKKVFEKDVKTNLPVGFVLNIPVFKGFDSIRFGVEICLETTEGSANFWFDSTELHELIKTEKDRILNTELLACDGFVIINK